MTQYLYFVASFGLLSFLAYNLLIFSDGLQQLGGSWCYRLVAKSYKSRLSLIFRGFSLTSIFQSPILAVQMIAGLLNAGLFDLRAALLMIAGVNLGQLSILLILGLMALSTNVLPYFLGLIIGMGYFLIRLSRTQWGGGIGKALIGWSCASFFLTIFFKYSKGVMISQLIPLGIEGMVLVYFIGVLVTAIFRSPGIAFILAISLAYFEKEISFFPILLMMGSLLAQSFRPMISTSNGNIYAKRVAYFHLLFGLISNLLFLVTLPLSSKLNQWGGEVYWILYLFFMVVTSIVFLLFQDKLLDIVIRFAPDSPINDQKHLEVLGDPRDMLPIMALVLGQRQVSKLQDIVNRMFLLTAEYVRADENQARIMAKLKDYERITDNIKREVTTFIHYLGEKPLSREQSGHAQSLLKLADELESVADYLDKVAVSCTRLREGSGLSRETKEEFSRTFSDVYELFKTTSQYIDPSTSKDSLNLSLLGDRAFTLKKAIEKIREERVKKLTLEGMGPTDILAYSDMLVAIRKVRSHTRNIGEALP